jgi:hypothetical protein
VKSATENSVVSFSQQKSLPQVGRKISDGGTIGGEGNITFVEKTVDCVAKLHVKKK